MNLSVAGALERQSAAGGPVCRTDGQHFRHVGQADREGCLSGQAGRCDRAVVDNLHGEHEGGIGLEIDGRRVGHSDGPIGADRERIAGVPRNDADVEDRQRRSIVVEVHDGDFGADRKILIDEGRAPVERHRRIGGGQQSDDDRCVVDRIDVNLERPRERLCRAVNRAVVRDRHRNERVAELVRQRCELQCPGIAG